MKLTDNFRNFSVRSFRKDVSPRHNGYESTRLEIVVDVEFHSSGAVRMHRLYALAWAMGYQRHHSLPTTAPAFLTSYNELGTVNMQVIAENEDTKWERNSEWTFRLNSVTHVEPRGYYSEYSSTKFTPETFLEEMENSMAALLHEADDNYDKLTPAVEALELHALVSKFDTKKEEVNVAGV